MPSCMVQGQGYRSGQSGNGLTNNIILVEIYFTYWDKETSTADFDFIYYNLQPTAYFNLKRSPAEVSTIKHGAHVS